MEKKSVVSDYETGRAIPQPGVIGKMERQLGVRLPRPPKKKKQQQQDE
jgi:putative transcription factor